VVVLEHFQKGDTSMSQQSVWNEYGVELERRVRLKTFPLAVKLLKDEGDIPKEAQRPQRDLGQRLMLCQGFQLSRREGITVAMLREDMWCHEPVIGYGLQEPPDYFFKGHTRYPRDVATLEAGKHYAQEFPRLEVGLYSGVVSAPLMSATFEPDVVMIYCDGAQLSLLLLAREWRDGYSLPSNLSSHAACVSAVIPAILNNQCHVALPCRGDHYSAMAADEEMIFTVPKGKLDDLIAGLRYVEKTDSRLPRGYKLPKEHPQPNEYEEIARMMGLR
jgi:uncharacterized protein (DUF169 family)